MIEESSLTFLGLVFLVSMGVMTWTLDRRRALIPLLITTCYMPLGQLLVIAGLHFQLFRLLLLVGACRVVVRNEYSALKLTFPDKLFLWWALVTLVMGILTGRGTTHAGLVYDALGAYFLFRFWIRDLDDVTANLRFLGWMILPLAISMVIEKFTSRNVFAVFGGVPAITNEREGTLRCQGAFRHPILAGTYAVTLLPLFVGLWLQKGRNKVPAIVGIAAAIVVTAAAGSSGPLLTFMCVIIGLCLWPVRQRMQMFRRGAVVALIILHLLMKAPAWYLIARMSDIVGGTGWYRSFIIDQAINHFREWFLIGSAVTAHWAPGGQVLANDPNNMDIINHYVYEGLGGGVLKLGLFITIIVQGFKSVARWANSRYIRRNIQFLTWTIGVGLAAHCVTFFSVSYFDQIIVMWYWLLAILSLLSAKNRWQGQGQVMESGGPVTSRGRPLTPVGV